MKKSSLSVLLAGIMVVALLAVGCTTTKTTTVTDVIAGPTNTITVPGSVVTRPAVTVTLPGGVTTLPAVTATVAPITIVPSTPQEFGSFLTDTPITITTHSGALITLLTGQCLQCHGTGLYLQYPEPPTWDGSVFGSLVNNAFYYVIPGSIQDHTGRTADECLTCHAVAASP